VRVAAAALNPIDLGVRAGRVLPADGARFPMVLGWDAAGTVDALGPGVAGYRLGQRVFGVVQQPAVQADRWGTHAEYVVLDADQLAPTPNDVDDATAAALPLAGITALQAVRALALAPGETLLVNNAAGAVGGLAAAIARAQGAQVLTPRREALAAAARGGVDAALDVLGREAAHATLAAVRDGGRYATTLPEWWAPGGPYAPARGITPVVIENQPARADLTELARLLGNGTLRPVVGRTFALDAAAEAHAALAAPGLAGKVVLVP
jgi:NADPH:quinone reductase-like Zn-dependent oxidoreductase